MATPRDALIVPVAVVLTGMWAATGVAAIITGKPTILLVVTGPFGVMCGYLFAKDIFRRADNGEDKP